MLANEGRLASARRANHNLQGRLAGALRGLGSIEVSRLNLKALDAFFTPHIHNLLAIIEDRIRSLTSSPGFIEPTTLQLNIRDVIAFGAHASEDRTGSDRVGCAVEGRDVCVQPRFGLCPNNIGATGPNFNRMACFKQGHKGIDHFSLRKVLITSFEKLVPLLGTVPHIMRPMFNIGNGTIEVVNEKHNSISYQLTFTT